MIENHESMTAKLCSFVRAHHSNNDRDKIFDDYLAFDLMGSDEYCNIRDLIKSGKCGACESCATQCPYRDKVSRTVHFLAPIPLSREAFAFDIFHEFTQKNPGCQYVICGAGMDSFLFRNEDPSISVFEVDHPDTQKYKKMRIAQLGWTVQKNITFVPVDFSRDNMADKLLKAGFDPSRPTLFTILGVTYYLTLQAFENTIELMDALSTSLSAVILDYPEKMKMDAHTPERVLQLAQMTEQLGEAMTDGFSFDEMRGVFARHHFEIQKHLSPKDIQYCYFSNRKDGLKAFENIHFLYAYKDSKDASLELSA
ncbi:MAG: class I SAM-dependent methyltransferase [Proteobacteria bacterium]|nr:class I SAM-dependent methyltransferase [Pseudomonadota bacterium]